MTLIVPIGPPGSGKTTLAHKLQMLGVIDADATVSPDEYRRIMTGARSNQDANTNVFAVAGLVAQTRLQHDLPVFFDATNVSAQAQTQLEAIMGHAPSATRINVMFNIPYEVLWERNQTREDRVPTSVLERMQDQFCALNIRKLPGATITYEECLTWAEKGWLK